MAVPLQLNFWEKETNMNRTEFEANVRAEHYTEISTVIRPVGYELDEHQHSFDACALITAGEITLVVDGDSHTYKVGEIFRMPAGVVHLESAGPQGVTYLVGRRERTAS